MEKLFPVIDNIFRTTAAAGAGLKRSLGIRGRHIHLTCTDIKIWHNFQEVIPFLLKAAA